MLAVPVCGCYVVLVAMSAPMPSDELISSESASGQVRIDRDARREDVQPEELRRRAERRERHTQGIGFVDAVVNAWRSNDHWACTSRPATIASKI